MTSLSKYKDEINSLASQLQKLLKVIRHSDPSADELKHLLHKKYQHHLSSIASQAKEHFLWDEFRSYLLSQTKGDKTNESGVSTAAIRKKLISDFEKQFIAKQVLNELSPPDPEEIHRQRELRKRRKAYQERQAAAKAEQQYSREEIMEMVQTTQKQRQARTELQSLISAIRKLDPEKIETKISQSIKSKDH